MAQTNPVDQIFIDLIKFFFNRYSPDTKPTNKQIRDGLHDFRKMNLGV